MARTNAAAEADSAKSTSKKSIILPLVVCLILSFALWAYVMSVDSPTSTEIYSSVPVTITGAESTGLSAITGSDAVIEVTLKGRKSILSQLSAGDIEAYIDVSGVKNAGRGRYQVTVNPPAGTVVDSFYPSEVTVYLDEKTIVSVPVRGVVKDYTVAANCTLDLVNYTKSIDSVQVSGPASELAKLDYARVVVRPGNITQSFSGTGSIELIDVNGSVVTSKFVTPLTTEATVSFNVYTTKYLTLSMEYRYGYFTGGGATVTLTPSRVQVRGLAELLATMSTVTVGTIDETKITENSTFGYALSLPDGVDFADSSREYDTVSASVVLNTYSRKIQVPQSSILLTGAPAGKTVTLDSNTSLSVTLMSTLSRFPMVTLDDLTVSVDVSAAGESTGDQYLPVSVVLKGGNSADCYVAGDYSVLVHITDGVTE
ncbi:MAG: hypothetical protein II719_02145 [Clostridia bacterium]|nr:hypothetical protein [Clostridia bacterium]